MNLFSCCSLLRGAKLLCAISIFTLSAPLFAYSYSSFPSERDPRLQAMLEQGVKHQALDPYLEGDKLSVTLVDVTDINQPKLAHINGTTSLYAASLPKIGILLAVFEEIQQGNIDLDESTRASLEKMIRYSSNVEATKLYERVGAARIAEILRSDRYRLYDETQGGGLWVGKPYAKQPAWKRDPMNNLSHGANGLQVARFYYMLQRNELADPEQCPIIKEMLGNPGIEHKFVKGLKAHRPQARVFRKSGTWRNYHSDSALIERSDGRSYIAVVIAEIENGSAVLSKLIVDLDKAIDQYHSL